MFRVLWRMWTHISLSELARPKVAVLYTATREFKKLLRQRLRLRQPVRYKTTGFNEQTNGLYVLITSGNFLCRTPQNKT